MSKYIGGFEGEEMQPISAKEVERVIADNRQYGSLKETRAACMRVLNRGDILRDAHGFGVRLTRLPE